MQQPARKSTAESAVSHAESSATCFTPRHASCCSEWLYAGSRSPLRFSRYALTTPFMPGNGPLGVAVVPTLNAIALNVTRARGIPAVDLCAPLLRTPCTNFCSGESW